MRTWYLILIQSAAIQACGCRPPLTINVAPNALGCQSPTAPARNVPTPSTGSTHCTPTQRYCAQTYCPSHKSTFDLAHLDHHFHTTPYWWTASCLSFVQTAGDAGRRCSLSWPPGTSTLFECNLTTCKSKGCNIQDRITSCAPTPQPHITPKITPLRIDKVTPTFLWQDCPTEIVIEGSGFGGTVAAVIIAGRACEFRTLSDSIMLISVPPISPDAASSIVLTSLSTGTASANPTTQKARNLSVFQLSDHMQIVALADRQNGRWAMVSPDINMQMRLIRNEPASVVSASNLLNSIRTLDGAVKVELSSPLAIDPKTSIKVDLSGTRLGNGS